MQDDAQRTFEQMEDEKLLATAAFFANEYTPEGRTLLGEVAARRGISEAEILAHRKTCWPDVAMFNKCESCDCEMMLSEDVFIDGYYVCPRCDSELPVNYFAIDAPPSIGNSVASFLSFGGIWGAARESKKYEEKREAIENGSFWQELRDSG